MEWCRRAAGSVSLESLKVQRSSTAHKAELAQGRPWTLHFPEWSHLSFTFPRVPQGELRQRGEWARGALFSCLAALPLIYFPVMRSIG